MFTSEISEGQLLELSIEYCCSIPVWSRLGDWSTKTQYFLKSAHTHFLNLSLSLSYFVSCSSAVHVLGSSWSPRGISSRHSRPDTRPPHQLQAEQDKPTHTKSEQPSCLHNSSTIYTAVCTHTVCDLYSDMTRVINRLRMIVKWAESIRSDDIE